MRARSAPYWSRDHGRRSRHTRARHRRPERLTRGGPSAKALTNAGVRFVAVAPAAATPTRLDPTGGHRHHRHRGAPDPPGRPAARPRHGPRRRPRRHHGRQDASRRDRRPHDGEGRHARGHAAEGRARQAGAGRFRRLGALQRRGEPHCRCGQKGADRAGAPAPAGRAHRHRPDRGRHHLRGRVRARGRTRTRERPGQPGYRRRRVDVADARADRQRQLGGPRLAPA